MSARLKGDKSDILAYFRAQRVRLNVEENAENAEVLLLLYFELLELLRYNFIETNRA